MRIPAQMPEASPRRSKKKRSPPRGIFDLIAKNGKYRSATCSILSIWVGRTLVVDAAQADSALGILRSAGEEAYILGEVVESDQGVILC